MAADTAEAAAAGVRTARIPRLEGRVTASDVFVVAALALLAPLASPPVALAAVAGAVFGPERKSLSAAAAAWTHLALRCAFSPSSAGTVESLFVAVAVYAATNLLLVAVAIRLAGGRGVGSTLVRLAGCVGISTLVSLFLAPGLVPVLDAVGPLGLALGLFATGPLAAYARVIKMRIEGRPSLEPGTADYASAAASIAGRPAAAPACPTFRKT